VTVEYVVANPERSRVVGLRERSSASWSIVVAPILLALALFGAVSRTRGGRKMLRVLEHGVVGYGKLVGADPQIGGSKRRPLKLLSFVLLPRLGDAPALQPVVVKHETDRIDETTDEHYEPMLVDPADPARALAIDALPCRTGFGSNGQLVCDGSRAWRRCSRPWRSSRCWSRRQRVWFT
jgi:hypothetical protein